MWGGFFLVIIFLSMAQSGYYCSYAMMALKKGDENEITPLLRLPTPHVSLIPLERKQTPSFLYSPPPLHMSSSSRSLLPPPSHTLWAYPHPSTHPKLVRFALPIDPPTKKRGGK
jgi:hypothetical protein